MSIEELEIHIKGKRSVKGLLFTQLKVSSKGYLYRKKDPYSGRDHYEVFKRVVGNKYDFLNKCKREGEYYVVYPSDEAFGKTAWDFTNYKQAVRTWQGL